MVVFSNHGFWRWQCSLISRTSGGTSREKMMMASSSHLSATPLLPSSISRASLSHREYSLFLFSILCSMLSAGVRYPLCLISALQCMDFGHCFVQIHFVSYLNYWIITGLAFSLWFISRFAICSFHFSVLFLYKPYPFLFEFCCCSCHHLFH